MTRCDACGADNSPRAKFCQECGAPLPSTPATQQRERKVVSVLFCDLVGFTARSDRADPEDVQATLVPYHRLLRTEIERYGGTVEKFIGDAVMAVFGAPVAHEDDAQRAVRAGLRILGAIEERNATEAEQLSVRIGVATGEAVVTLAVHPAQGEGFVAGDVVNTAARLQTAASPGGLLVSEATWRLTRAQVEYEPLPAITVKGKADPIPIWRATATRSRLGVDLVQSGTPFIGREDELEVLRRTFTRAARVGSVQLVTILGEPGVGKSRLVTEFRTWVDGRDELVSWRQGHCLSYGDAVTFWALGEVVKAHAGILESDDVDTAAGKLAAAVAAVADAEDAAWLVSALGPLVGLPAAHQRGREELFTGWRRFIEGIAADTPLVIVLEDLHWADPALLGFVEHLLDWSAGVPLVLVGTARPELYEKAPGWGGGRPNATTIGLAPLSDTETSRLLAALLQTAVLPAETQALLLERAGGNPLYAEEFVRVLVDRELLSTGPVRRLEPDAEVALPDSVQALIAARLDTLPAPHKRTLQDAAVLGKVVWSGAVAALGRVEEAQARSMLHDLARREFLKPARLSTVAGQAEYAFTHPLMRDVAYGQIPRQDRSTRHLAAADWIEQMAGERVADHAEVLAHHLVTALDLAHAAGDAAGHAGLAERAARAMVRAAESVASLDAEAAVRLYRRALDLLPADSRDRANVLCAAGSRPGHASYAAAIELLRQALDIYRQREDLRGAGECLAQLGAKHQHVGDLARSASETAEAISLLERVPVGPALALAYGMAAFAAAVGGRAGEALPWTTKALAVPDAPAQAILNARTARVAARLSLGDAGAAEDQRAAIDAAVAVRDRRAEAIGHENLAEVLWLTAGVEPAMAAYRTATALTTRYGMREVARQTDGDGTKVLLDAGSWDELLQLVEQHSADSSDALRYFSPLGQVHALHVRAWRGDALAHGALDAVATQARGIGDAQIFIPVLALGAVVHQLAGDEAAALALVGEYQSAVPEGELYRWRHVVDVVRVCAQAGSPDLAAELLPRDEPKLLRNRLCHRTAHAILTEAHGDLPAAAAEFTELVTDWRAYGNVPEQGFAGLGLGRCRLQLGDPGAADALHTAREVFLRLRARPLVAETDDWLARTVAATSS